jgi:hypothetical protein
LNFFNAKNIPEMIPAMPANIHKKAPGIRAILSPFIAFLPDAFL